jgi:hemoglobin-like flavoprotein
MTPEQIARVRTSFALIAPRAEAVGQVFYATLFRLNPTARALFAADIGPQVHKLMDMLGTIVRGLDRPQQLQLLFRDLGRRHVGYGVTEEQYDDVGAALLMALREALGADFGEDLEAAWATVYADLAETMIASARG